MKIILNNFIIFKLFNSIINLFKSHVVALLKNSFILKGKMLLLKDKLSVISFPILLSATTVVAVEEKNREIPLHTKIIVGVTIFAVVCFLGYTIYGYMGGGNSSLEDAANKIANVLIEHGEAAHHPIVPLTLVITEELIENSNTSSSSSSSGLGVLSDSSLVDSETSSIAGEALQNLSSSLPDDLPITDNLVGGDSLIEVLHNEMSSQSISSSTYLDILDRMSDEFLDNPQSLFDAAEAADKIINNS
jgi:hypothetical protein